MDPHTSDSQDFQREINEALDLLANTIGEDLARQIRPILSSNLDRRRIDYFLGNESGSVRDYVSLVAGLYGRLHPYLHQLQSERSPEAWGPLFERMQTWAYNYFLRKNFAADGSTREIAVECATNAALNLLNASFPYDTEFDPWAHILVQNVCRKYIHQRRKKSVIPDEKKVELDDELGDPNAPLLELGRLQKEAGDRLEEALKQLTDARRQVIQSIYFDELEPEEIARRMGRSVGAIYGLQFHALQDLRKILQANRDNLNE